MVSLLSLHINRRREGTRENLIKPVSDFLFWIFFGIVLADFIIGGGGKNIW